MYNYVRKNILSKLPQLIEESIKSVNKTTEDVAIDNIINQINYYMQNHCKNFNPTTDDIKIEINPITININKKFGCNPYEEYILHIKLFGRKTKVGSYNPYIHTMRELLFLLYNGKILTIYHYKLLLQPKLEKDWKKIYTIHRDVLMKIREHSNC